MKHIFHVHSHITFLVSKQYVIDKGINLDDCLFLCSRDFKPGNEDQQLFKHITNYPQDVLRHNVEKCCFQKKIFHRLYKLHVIEDFILTFCNKDNFLFYTFSTYSHLCCIIVTMNKCSGYYLIEEGSSVYTDISKVKQSIGKKNLLLQAFLAPLFPRFYLLKDHHFSTSSNKYLGTIATSEKAFSQLGGEHIVISNPFNKKCLSYPPTAVISIDASLYLYNIDLECITKIIQFIYNFILQRHEKPIVAYKVHPMITDNNADKPYHDILSTTFHDVMMLKLSSDTAIEEVLNEYNCDFYSDWSSVAIYANQMGCTCYSYAQKLLEICNNRSYESKFNNMKFIIDNYYIQLL